jgi:hypothetical protein
MTELPVVKFPLQNHQERGLIVKMDELERELNKHDPIGDIAAIVGKLTYGEMVQLATELAMTQPADQTVPASTTVIESMMKRFHDWQKGRGVTV